MKKTLYLKFCLAYLIFGIFGFVIIAVFISNLTLEHLRREKADALYQEATLIANTYASDLYDNTTSLDTVKKQLDALASYLSARLWIINPSGRMILDSSKPINIQNEIIVENFDPIITVGSYYTIGNFFNYFEDDMLSVFAPITTDYEVKGYVVIHSNMQELQQSKENMLKISYITFLVLFLLSGIILIFFTEAVYKPLCKITTATEQFACGNMHYELQVESNDEMGYLAAILSYMAGEIAKSEDNQKKLVANVSHDFRSPLTSIKGFLEAMQDGTIPPELYPKYIGIVLNETDRLIKLTNSLLTLNNLNTKGMILEKTNFDINQIIRNTVIAFEPSCIEKKIAVELILTSDIMTVNADMGKIQQVLYNLLDNAIKFSPNNSILKIETYEKHNKIFISVKDNGIGIPKESLKQIWGRFYKTDLSRGKDKKGTGLGLSIVKEIIQSHNENINVISTEGVGTEFVFSLPIVDNKEES